VLGARAIIIVCSAQLLNGFQTSYFIHHITYIRHRDHLCIANKVLTLTILRVNV